MINLIKIIANASYRDIKSISVFEIGNIFPNLSGIKSPVKQLTMLRSGIATRKSIYNIERKFDLFDIKADLCYVFRNINIKIDEISYRLKKTQSSIYSLVADIYIDTNKVGYIGKLKDSFIKQYTKKENNVLEITINLNNIKQLINKNKKKSISDYQVVNRDFAFVIDIRQNIGEILQKINKLNKNIAEVCLFDIYKGKNIDSNKKSIAFRITIQPDKNNITEKEIDKISQKIKQFMLSEYNSNLRE